MHALRNVHRLLVPRGTLLDLHPVPPSARVLAGGADLGPLDERAFFAEVRATERELARSGLFEHETEVELDVIERYHTHDQLRDSLAEWETARMSKRLEARVRRAEPPIDLREHLVLRRFRAV